MLENRFFIERYNYVHFLRCAINKDFVVFNYIGTAG